MIWSSRLPKPPAGAAILWPWQETGARVASGLLRHFHKPGPATADEASKMRPASPVPTDRDRWSRHCRRRLFVISLPFVAADVFNLGIGGYNWRKPLRQRLEIAGVLEPAVHTPLNVLLSLPEQGLVARGWCGDLDSWCPGCARLVRGDFPLGRLGSPSSAFVSIDELSAFSLPSFAGGVAGVASGLSLCFLGGFPRYPLGEFRIAGFLLSFQSGLTSGSFGGLSSG